MRWAAFAIWLLAFAAKSEALTVKDFSDNPDVTRENFLASAQKLKASNPAVVIEAIPVPSESGQSLFIDSVYVPDASAPDKNLVILTSGIHGVEAPAGSFLERMVLDELPSTSHTAYLFLNTVNPYGFKNGRRFNEHNVDLNRNCFDYRQSPFPGASLKNSDYVDYSDFFEAPMTWIGLSLKGMLHADKIRHALSGQYRYPKGIYYGGQKVEPECEALEKALDARLGSAVNVLHIDFHTGLGSRGILQLMLNPPPTEPPLKTAYGREVAALKQKLFVEADCRGVCEVQEAKAHDFQTNGDLSQWIDARYPEKRSQGLVIAVTAEIGTEGPLTVLPAIANETYCHMNAGKCSTEEALDATLKLQEAFNPKDSTWRDQVYKAGLVLRKALAAFAAL